VTTAGRKSSTPPEQSGQLLVAAAYKPDHNATAGWKISAAPVLQLVLPDGSGIASAASSPAPDGRWDVETVPALQRAGPSFSCEFIKVTRTRRRVISALAGYNTSMAIRTYNSRSTVSLLSVVLVVWLVIGAIAAGQRHYYDSSVNTCAKAGTITVTILAGPLNYLGVNPKINCHTPQPSK